MFAAQDRLASIDEMLALAAHGRPSPDDANSEANGAPARPRTRTLGAASGGARRAGASSEPSVERLAGLLGGSPADLLEAQHLRAGAGAEAQEWVVPSYKRLKERHLTLQLLLVKHHRRARHAQLRRCAYRAWHALVARRRVVRVALARFLRGTAAERLREAVRTWSAVLRAARAVEAATGRELALRNEMVSEHTRAAAVDDARSDLAAACRVLKRRAQLAESRSVAHKKMPALPRCAPHAAVSRARL